MKAQSEALAKAVAYLSSEALGADEPAVEVEPGFWAFKSENPTTLQPCWRVASAEDMKKCGANLPRAENGEPPEWVMDEAIMPAWWSPKRRIAWKFDDYPSRFPSEKAARKSAAWIDEEAGTTNVAHHFKRITASLEDGREMPA
jgi:hypothetical protein